MLPAPRITTGGAARATSGYPRRMPHPTPVEVVAQDEYTHDVIVAGEAGTYLVYDMT